MTFFTVDIVLRCLVAPVSVLGKSAFLEAFVFIFESRTVTTIVVISGDGHVF